jgi:hypothetical protein
MADLLAATMSGAKFRLQGKGGFDILDIFA